MDIQSIYAHFKASTGISTDTRTLQPGQLFVALSGDNFDGNTYVDTAFAKAASHVICTNPDLSHRSDVTVVEDSLQTLQDLARYHRGQIDIPIVGLTGSNGKTTTKELILSVLSQTKKVKGTVGNLNNHIGVPLTLLSFDESLDVGVVEMGANHIGEIAQLCEIARPNYGLITNFGKAHLEGFGSLEGVKIGKSEIYQFLQKTNGTAFIVANDQEQINRTEHQNAIKAPQFEVLSSQPIQLKWKDHNIETQITGIYNVSNMELAAAVGLEFGLSEEVIATGLSAYKPENNRSQLIHRDGYTIIKDAYNANPTSMKAALESLALLKGKRVAILGDMFEMGSYAHEEHQAIANLCQELKLDEFYLIGENFNQVESTPGKTFKNLDEFKQQVLPLALSTKSHVLIKGSRGMALERVVDLLEKPE